MNAEQLTLEQYNKLAGFSQFDLVHGEIEACSKIQHHGIGWLWYNGRLLTKSVDEHAERDEEVYDDGHGACASHYMLFGDKTYQAAYRGWFHRGRLIFMTSNRMLSTVRSADDIPEQLYQHLYRKFKFTACKIIIP